MQLHGVTDYVLVTFCTFFLVRLPTENSQSEKDHVIHDRILGLFALLMYTCINLTINLLAYQIIGLSIILFLLVYFLFYSSDPLKRKRVKKTVFATATLRQRCVPIFNESIIPYISVPCSVGERRWEFFLVFLFCFFLKIGMRRLIHFSVNLSDFV
jgi:hypothetical protein